MKFAIWHDSNGNRLLGSDSVFPLDGRWSHATTVEKMREHRERFKGHFPLTHAAMRKAGCVNRISDDPKALFDIV